MRRLSILAALAVLAACSNANPVKRPVPPPSPSTTTINFSTYLGKDLLDSVRDAVLDSAGNVFVVGGATSTDLLPGTPTRAAAGKEDAFVAKLDPSGQVVWWTFLGGPGPDRGYAIDLDPAGDLVIGGSAADSFPVTPGAVLTQFQGGQGLGDANNPAADGFVAKLAGANGALVWASYFGSGTFEQDVDTNPNDTVTDFNDDNDPRTSFVHDVAVDPVTGDIYLTFSFLSSAARLKDTDNNTATLEPFNRILPPVILAALQNGDQPNSPALDTGLGSSTDEILAKLTPDGTALPWATFVGGRGTESAAMVVRLDAQGNPVVLTSTASFDRVTAQNPSTKVVVSTAGITQNGFDGTLAVDSTLSPTQDFYVAKFALNGPLIWATYLGGGGAETIESNSLFVGPNAIVVVGQTTSGDFTSIGGSAFDHTFNGSSGTGFYSADCAIGVMAPDASALQATTYYGGAFGEGCTGVVVDSSSRIYVTGGTTSPDLPIRSGPFQTQRPGPFSAFLAIFSSDLSTLHYSGYFGGTGAGNANVLLLRSDTATSGRVIVAGGSEAGYPLSASPARGTVTAPPAHGVLSDLTLGF